MLIRKMEESDLTQVCAMEKEIFSEPWGEEDFRKALQDKNNGYLVAEVQGKIAGYCGYWGVSPEGYIYNVAVQKEYRRQQIGYQMLRKLIAEAKENGIRALTLEVRYFNTPAINLYKRLGFTEAGIRRGFYSNPTEDAVIMWLKPIQ
ncbi:MAG TPA: ribosomal-protein-alanine N-acetyltransferase [Lachnospiraceae bacterium]|nr:ribosomal-protein-alanine N-acetyltransferase [Lachnospiraceae bacterium]